MVPRYGHACALSGKDIVITGGRTQKTVLNVVEALNIK
jgi:hypothetical protein